MTRLLLLAIPAAYVLGLLAGLHRRRYPLVITFLDDTDWLKPDTYLGALLHRAQQEVHDA